MSSIDQALARARQLHPPAAGGAVQRDQQLGTERGDAGNRAVPARFRGRETIAVVADEEAPIAIAARLDEAEKVSTRRPLLSLIPMTFGSDCISEIDVSGRRGRS